MQTARLEAPSHWLAYFKPHWWKYALGAPLIALAVFSEFLIPKTFQWAIDSLASVNSIPSFLIQKTPADRILFLVWLVSGALGVHYLCQAATRWGFMRLTFHEMVSLKRTIWHRALRLPCQQDSGGRLINLATTDARVAGAWVGSVPLSGLTQIFIFLFCLGFMLTIDSALTLAYLVICPFFGVAIQYASRSQNSLFQSAQEQLSRLSHVCSQALQTIRLQRLTETGGFWVGRQKESAINYSEKRLAVLNHTVFIEGVGYAFTWVSFSVVASFAIVRVFEGALSPGQFVAFIAYLGWIQGPMASAGSLVSQWIRGRVSRERIEALADKVSEDTVETRAPVDGLYRGEISFSYQNKRILDRVSIQTLSPSVTVITGPTGSGKSTLMRILAGAASGYHGSLRLDGVEVSALSLEQRSRLMTYVGEPVPVFSGTVAENLTLGENYDPNQLWDVLEKVALDDEVRAFSSGLETRVGEMGQTLSGGQRQRLSLARAWLRDTPIYLMDNPLSAVDPETQKRILNHLNSFFKGKTVFWATPKMEWVPEHQHGIQLRNSEGG